MRVHLVVQVLCQSDSFMLSMPALHVYILVLVPPRTGPQFSMRRKRKFDGKTLHTQTDPGTDATCVTVYDDTTIRRYDDRSFFGEIGKIDHFLVNTHHRKHNF